MSVALLGSLGDRGVRCRVSGIALAPFLPIGLSRLDVVDVRLVTRSRAISATPPPPLAQII